MSQWRQIRAGVPDYFRDRQPRRHGLKKHDIRVSTVVFMIFCLVAAGCYGIEEMIPECGPGLTIIMLCVLP